MSQLVLIALATFGSEDLTCIATGGLIAAGKLGFLPGVLACIAGIFAGDLLLYFAGRFAGRTILGHLPGEKMERASRWLSDRGAGVVILSRFTPGLRLPTYVAAGLLKTRFWTFTLYFLLAATLWTPVLVGTSALLGKKGHVAFFGPALLLVSLPLRNWQRRRRIVGWVRRRIRWEFWPPWLAYLPLAPYLLYLAIRHRSLTVFLAANPGIPWGGFTGESKSAILAQLPWVPEFTVIPAGLPIDRRPMLAEFLEREVLEYPVVLKPDVGERGRDVAIARTEAQAHRYLEQHPAATIVQRYVEGLEFGIFYYRYPGEKTGRISSITRKLFPEVTGDGSSTITELVLRDERAVCLANTYLARFSNEVPARGERIRLVELGSHCRGAIFLDGAGLESEALRAAIDRAARSHAGFYFGRFDIRAASIEDLQAGRFHILELNGVSAEAAHIYDPAISLWEAYRVLFRHWRIAFEIGARNRSVAPSWRDLLRVAYRRPVT